LTVKTGESGFSGFKKLSESGYPGFKDFQDLDVV
jgi:hypothetical protein